MTDSREIPSPPRLIPTLVSGFDAIANHTLVILFPIIFDLVIWFSPHLRLKRIITRLIESMVLLTPSDSQELAEMIEIGKDAWFQIADQINLIVAIRSYPVGIPSLMVSSLPNETPLGYPLMIDVSTFELALIIVISLVLLGLLGGTLYYQAVSQIVFRVNDEEQPGISFFEFKDGLIHWVVEFWPEPYDPPARQFDAIERY